MPHLDGPLYYPTIATINLGSHTVLDFYKQLDDQDTTSDKFESLDEAPCSDPQDSTSLHSRYVGSFLLERRSLVCFKQDMYNVYLHGIEELSQDSLRDKNILNINFSGDGVEGDSTRERGTRVSLTIRHFPKVLKINLGNRFGKR